MKKIMHFYFSFTERQEPPICHLIFVLFQVFCWICPYCIFYFKMYERISQIRRKRNDFYILLQRWRKLYLSFSYNLVGVKSNFHYHYWNIWFDTYQSITMDTNFTNGYANEDWIESYKYDFKFPLSQLGVIRDFGVR